MVRTSRTMTMRGRYVVLSAEWYYVISNGTTDVHGVVDVIFADPSLIAFADSLCAKFVGG
jgi:hypothetical protein